MSYADIIMSIVTDPTVLADRAGGGGDGELAFLPNLVPTYRDEHSVGLFSLFHETPSVDHGWRPMLRGLHLPKLLVCKQTIDFLEKCNGVEWKPLPPNNDNGSAGVVFDLSAFDRSDVALAAMCATLSLGDVDDPEQAQKEAEPINKAPSADAEPDADSDESDSSEDRARGAILTAV